MPRERLDINVDGYWDISKAWGTFNQTTRYHTKTCNRHTSPLCVFHALPLQNMKWTCIQKFYYQHEDIAKYLPLLLLQLPATSACKSFSRFLESKREIDTLDRRSYYTFCCNTGFTQMRKALSSREIIQYTLSYVCSTRSRDMENYKNCHGQSPNFLSQSLRQILSVWWQNKADRATSQARRDP